ncbi:MAG: 5'-3' exonuclease H3TH domain-containing protein [Candidatus Korobacteraceae bacterium]
MPPKKKSAQDSAATKPVTAPKLPQDPAGSKGRIFLIDSMWFIFRAYHAMARPMSTKTGIPTSATFIFVNMLRKLRADFNPQYLAAVFDVAAATFRDEQATAMPSFRKFDAKTQTHIDVQYKGYKADRPEMQADLAQQIPYIRRALEAYRIPILEASGFEADDVIGTLARKAAAEGYTVFIVSSDKDMMQLVNERVWILNPLKDNLIYDPAKVQEILGVPPERVIDVMALRGDTIDNIPGAPGIGDKGSVDLIQRFGSVEAALERAAEIERKTYRESLQNNRDMVLLSKELVTIKTDVAVDFDPSKMEAQTPDPEAARVLFTELEFNTLVQDFLTESVELGDTDYREATAAKDVEALIAEVRNSPDAFLAVALESGGELVTEAADEPEDEPDKQMTLTAAAETTNTQKQLRLAISAKQGSALSLSLDDSAAALALKQALADPSLPKAVHDSKAATHVLADRGIALAGVQHDPLLYAY